MHLAVGSLHHYVVHAHQATAENTDTNHTHQRQGQNGDGTQDNETSKGVPPLIIPILLLWRPAIPTTAAEGRPAAWGALSAKHDTLNGASRLYHRGSNFGPVRPLMTQVADHRVHKNMCRCPGQRHVSSHQSVRACTAGNLFCRQTWWSGNKQHCRMKRHTDGCPAARQGNMNGSNRTQRPP